ncbi:DNA cross-link repair 1A protein [Protopterus annectens]|uniref:DNA cross-link repair 1A protein n=1 Tax=Protopterus annectens TaxID=7888 RepID=UPI001CFB33B7|nr:DNA cross-link repair 1A protein [Protopterus annectens]
MSEDALEENIWGYKSLRKPKVPDTQSSKFNGKGSDAKQKGKPKSNSRANSNKKNKGYCEGRKASQKLLTSNDHKEDVLAEEMKNEQSQTNDVSQTPKNARPLLDGHCPVCQMPFFILLVQTPRWHVSECLETPGYSEIECPDGLQCTSPIPSHYKRYTHFKLAERRSWGESEISREENTECKVNGFCTTASGGSNNDHYQQESKGPPTNSGGKQIALLKFDSGQRGSEDKLPKDRSKRSHFSSAGQLSTKRSHESSLFYGTQKGGCHFESKMPLQNIEVDSEEEISYSPLCSEDELNIDGAKNPRKKLDFGRDFEENPDGNGILNSFGDLEPSQKERDSGHSITSKFSFKKEDPTSAETFQVGLTTVTHRSTSRINRLTEPYPVDSSKVKQEPDEFQLSTANCHPDMVDMLGSAAANLTPWKRNRVSQAYLPNIKEEEASSPELFSQACNLEKLEPSMIRKRKATSDSIYNSCSQLCSKTPTSMHLSSDSQKENKSSSISVANPSDVLYRSSQMASIPSSFNSLLSTQPSTSKGLKQTDIGVFFGLKPKVVNDEDSQTTLKQQTATPKDDSAKLKPKGGHPKQRKRKADEFVEDIKTSSDAVSVKEHNTETLTRQTRGKKRFKEGGAAAGAEVYSANNKKQCPFYKKIPGTRFVVDAFQYGEIPDCNAYFLTHFHSDHYIGLKKTFRCPVYCSRVTGNLVRTRLRVEEQYIKTLPMNTECVVDGIKVVLLDANHCPGAVLLLFVLPNGTTILHTGDFRADSAMEQYSALQKQKIDTLYLDTTYCSPKYTFPSQQDAIQFAVNIAFETVALNPRTLVVCGTYAIGKEKVFLAIAGVLGCKASMFIDKYNTLKCLESQTVNSLITTDFSSGALHVLPMMRITFKHLQAHLSSFSDRFDQVLAFKPTGWTYTDKCDSLTDIKPQVRGKITIYGIPYSEHSSYLEMKRFVQWLKPNKIIPTVNMGSWESRKVMEGYFREWKAEVAKKSVSS